MNIEEILALTDQYDDDEEYCKAAARTDEEIEIFMDAQVKRIIFERYFDYEIENDKRRWWESTERRGARVFKLTKRKFQKQLDADRLMAQLKAYSRINIKHPHLFVK